MTKFERHWCMPNHETFKIKPFKNLIQDELGNKYLDPFPYPFEKDAIKYMKSFGDRSVDKIVFDPPYSQRQLKEMYKNAGQSFNHPMNSGYWAVCKKEIGRIMELGGKVISFGWNSNGIGKKYGFQIYRIVLVAHGSQHNDTIATVERKIR